MLTKIQEAISNSKKIVVHRIKEKVILFKYYAYNKATDGGQLFVSKIDDRRNSFGLTDRLKGIVSLYAFSKIKNVNYKCSFTHPFELSAFLEPNAYNWLPGKDEISTSRKNVRVIILQGEDEKRLIHLSVQKQLHAYINRDYLPALNKSYGTDFKWGELFNDLFKPTPKLEAQINYYLNQIGSDFIGCVFRFQSLLGDFEEYNFSTLEPAERETLIANCIGCLVELKKEKNMPLLVTSDSSTFISEVSKIDGIITMSGRVVHMDCVDNESDEVYMKSFVDFLMLSKATKIYSIGTSRMYPTEFPLYAAKVNNIPFERILI
jgi:hypothetical protein